MELTLVGLQNSGKTTLVNVIAVSDIVVFFGKNQRWDGNIMQVDTDRLLSSPRNGKSHTPLTSWENHTLVGLGAQEETKHNNDAWTNGSWFN